MDSKSCLPLVRWFAFVMATCWPALNAVAQLEDETSRHTASDRKIEILRDCYGVPHIYAHSLADACYGLGYCQVEDNLNEILRNYILARAEGGEAFGPEAVENDFQLRALKIPQINQHLYGSMKPKARQIVDAYAEGLNRYLADHPEEKPEWFDRATGLDVVAAAKAFQLMQTVAVMRDDLKRIARRDRRDEQEDGDQEASNMWAVGPARSSRGETMLLSDPHLPWTGRMKWYESHLIVGDRWLYGASFFGGPAAGIGFTQDIAWGSTNNSADTADVYRERLKPDNPDQYLYNGEWRDIASETIELKVRGTGGKILVRRRTVRRTLHGPIVQEDRGRSVAYAARLAGLDTVNLAATATYYFNAHRIADLEALYDAGHLYKWHRIACDRHGDIGYWFMAATHQRDDRFDWHAPVDGTITETQWGPRMSWRDMPHMLNPPSGLLVNCNNNPYTVAEGRPIDPHDFPNHLAGKSTRLAPDTRAYRAFELLAAEQKIDFAAMQRTATDVKALTADVYLKGVLDAYDSAGSGISDPGDRLRRAVKVLKNWDGQATVDNTALPILAALVEVAGKTGGPGQRGAVKPRQVLAALSKALDLLEKRWRSIEVPWGRVHVTRRGNIELPIGGAGNAAAADPFTTLLMAGARQVQDGKYVTASGSSWIQLVKFHQGTVEARTILPYGNSNRPNSPHFADQMPLFATGKLKKALIARSDIEANCESRQVFIR